MATVTPNFNWPVPTSTDLVKDGATAIEALGDSIDASMVDLKGGTSGQVLSKNSNTDMDFVWVTSDDANAIQNTIVDAKGDLITATAADTPARLAVGSNGETLVADSSTSTGLRYTAGTVQANPFLNSAQQIWQRGTSFSFTNGQRQFTSDRWEASSNNGTGTVSRQVTGDTTNLPFIQYCTRFQRTAGQTGTGGNLLCQNFETVNSIPFSGKTITVSYYARAGANFSGTFTPVLAYGTGTDQNIFVGLTGQTSIANTPVTLTTTWQRFSFTVSVAAASTQLAFYFNGTGAGTAGANDYYEVTGMQMDIGSVALPFRTNAGTIQGELSACQRYYWRGSGLQGVNAVLGSAQAVSTTAGRGYVTFPVTMRTAPTSVDWSSLSINEIAAGYTVSTLTLVGSGLENPNMGAISFTTTGLNAYRYYAIVINNTSSGFLGFSAEL